MVLFIALPLITYTDNASAQLGVPTPAAGDGCLPDTSDPDCDPATCSISGTAGLIPCGKNCDDPDTTWVETQPCSLCSMILMGQLLIEFMLKISAVAAILCIAFGGILYIFAAGNQGTIEKAKSIIKYVLLGFVIIFVAWALVDTILAMFGYIDPAGGEWYSMNC